MISCPRCLNLIEEDLQEVEIGEDFVCQGGAFPCGHEWTNE